MGTIKLLEVLETMRLRRKTERKGFSWDWQEGGQGVADMAPHVGDSGFRAFDFENFRSLKGIFSERRHMVDGHWENAF